MGVALKLRIWRMLFASVVACVLVEQARALLLSRADAIEAIRAAQGQLRAAQFEMRSQGPESGSGAPTEEEGTKTFFARGLLAAGAVPRFKVHCETEGVIYVVDGADGQEKPVWTAWKVDGSFDGNQGMALEYGPGKDGKPTLGKILNDQPLHVQTPLLNRKLEQTLYFYGGKGLTTFLDEIPPELPPWEVLPPEDPDILRIWHPDPKAALNDEFEEWSFVLLLDMSRGTNIVRRERWSNYGEPNAFLCNVTEDVVLTRFDDVWLPVSQQYKTCHLDATGQRMVSTVTLTSTFQWSAVNEPISADTFRIDFPPGCFIEDDVRGMSYRAGVTAHEHLQQVEQAVAELETMRARDRSREEGASSSTSSSGLNVVPRVDQAERRHHHRYIGFAVAVCLVLLAGALAIRGSRRRCREHHARQE